MAKAKYYGTGRRKSSVARVYLVPGTGKITINKRDMDEYFGLDTLKLIVRQPLVLTETADKYDVITLAVKGMLPKGPLGRSMITKLHVYAGAEHPHAAQKPEALEIKF